MENKILVAVEKKQSRKIQNRNDEIKYISEFEILTHTYASEPCCPTPMGTIGISDKVDEIIKIYGSRGILTRTYCLRNFCPHGTAETI